MCSFGQLKYQHLIIFIQPIITQTKIFKFKFNLITYLNFYVKWPVEKVEKEEKELGKLELKDIILKIKEQILKE